jgi:hypothetical protein
VGTKQISRSHAATSVCLELRQFVTLKPLDLQGDLHRWRAPTLDQPMTSERVLRRLFGCFALFRAAKSPDRSTSLIDRRKSGNSINQRKQQVETWLTALVANSQLCPRRSYGRFLLVLEAVLPIASQYPLRRLRALLTGFHKLKGERL